MMVPARILVDGPEVIERALVHVVVWRGFKVTDDLFQTSGLPEQPRIALAVEVLTDAAEPRPDVFRLVLFAFGKLFDLGALGNVPRLCRRLDVERRNGGDAWRAVPLITSIR